MLADRHVKLLSRQRGSALRKIDHDVVISQIKKPRLDRPSLSVSPSKSNQYDPEHEPSLDLPQPPSEVHFPADLDDPASTPPHSPVLRNGLLTSPEILHTSPTRDQAPAGQEMPDNYLDLAETISPPSKSSKSSQVIPLVPEFDFSGLPISQLRTNSLSQARIEVIWSLLNNLFEEQLIPQAFADHDTASNAADQLTYKLDIKLLSTFLHGILSDLQDTLDINASNNELCSQLKACAKQKATLTETLVDLRQQITDWENKEDNDAQLQEMQLKSALNDKLQSLAIGDYPSADEGDAITNPQPLEPIADDLIQLLDPQDGILGKLKTFNTSLEKLLD
ncbi:LAFA_0C04742g1_1 [Lachancea sp. 'fantastica']|nr:LAFA_0C04742g1_1 [Lachancea sp. 'fantastica']